MNTILPSETTRFYSDCIGVFQGGGCCAAAFAGAYEVAYRRGVRFHGLAGTSAGSIAAALIAAGANPTYVLEKLGGLDFNIFLKPPEHTLQFKMRFWLRKLLGWYSKELASIAQYGGMYSSQSVSEWIEKCLQEVLKVQGRPVQFSDLPFPLHVIAGSLRTNQPHIWSTETTPGAFVAHAVRASCSIPYFFQPVREGDALYVDGGIVSNLPTYLFANNSSRPSGKMLLFTLVSSGGTAEVADVQSYTRNLVSLVIGGAMHIQTSLARNYGSITIDTGNVNATDFDKMNAKTLTTLIESGRDAAARFFKSEAEQVNSPRELTSAIGDEHEYYLSITQDLHYASSRVVISHGNTKWFWELFPTIYTWLRKGIRITAYAKPSDGAGPAERKEGQRRKLIQQFGINLIETTTLPFEGVLIDHPGTATSRAVILPPEPGDYLPYARQYYGRSDETLLAALSDKVKEEAPAKPPQTVSPMTLLEGAELLKRIKHVRAYSHPYVNLCIEEVRVTDVKLISRFVRAFRYRQIVPFIGHYQERGIPLFAPAKVALSGDQYSIVTPPVVEQVGDSYVAMEGNTRFLYCLKNGIERVTAVVVRGVQQELPGKPVPLEHVTITSAKRSPEDRIAKFNYDLFREIERAVRPWQ